MLGGANKLLVLCHNAREDADRFQAANVETGAGHDMHWGSTVC